MPYLRTSAYKRPYFLISGHMETIYPALFRKVKDLSKPERERIKTRDGDFLDLDWWRGSNKKLIILQHGLEGSSDRSYILGMAKFFHQNKYDVLAWNFRSCGGEMNRLARYYHSGATDDLDDVIKHAAENYKEISLLGFSLGGNLTLKYLGEAPRDKKIKNAVAISVPLDLDAGANNLKKFQNFIYEKRFLQNLKKKILEKSEIMPDKIDRELLKEVKSLRDFDDKYTAPLHGFKDASDYYAKNSAKYYLDGIKVPTLILNAANDPLLTRESRQASLVENNPKIIFEISRQGGHVGFATTDKTGVYWSEKRALEFCQAH